MFFRLWLSYFLYKIWALLWIGFLKLLIRNEYRNIKITKKLLNVGLRLFYVRRVAKGIVQTRIADNVIYQPVDNMVYIIWEIYLKRLYDKYYTYHKDDVVIDIGAHVGLLALKAARNVNDGIVVAVEPHPINYNILVRNINQNKINNIISLNIALSDSSGTLKLWLAEETGMHSAAIKRSNKYIKVKAKTLDQLVSELHLKKVNFIKIDVEGYGFEVLKGAEKTLRNKDLFIVISCGHSSKEFMNVSKYLANKGFKIRVDSRNNVYAYARLSLLGV